MKVAVVSIGSFDTQYSDYHLMRDIILGLLKRGHMVSLIQKQYLENAQYPNEFYPYLGNQLKVENICFEQKAKADLKARYMADLSYYLQACKIMKKDCPDKIFLQSNNTAFFPIFYARHILKCPIIYNEQDIFPENARFAGILSSKSITYLVGHMLQKYAYKNANGLSTISDDMKFTITEFYGIPESKVRVVYNWGHEESKANRIEENTFLKKYPKLSKEFRIVYAGNLGKMQNVELILHTAELMKDERNVSFYIVGGGVNENELKSFAKEKGLSNVKFVGMQPAGEVADLYASADVNVIPLRKGIIYAALPSKTADCLLAGRPIVTCVDMNSFFAKLVRKFGLENADPNSPESLKNCLLKIKNSDKSANNHGLWAKYFRKDIGVEKYCHMVESVK